MSHADILSAAKLAAADLTGGALEVHSPIDGALIGEVATHSGGDVEKMIAAAKAAFSEWKLVPAPRRGELIRLFGEELRDAKNELGALVALEAGKIFQEGLGEVQEMIDICDLAVGQSRQLFGLTIASERQGHAMRETWHPLGVVGVISAFNFPVAVFAWNFALAAVAGNSTVWKPSEKTPLTALAVQKIFKKAAERFGEAPEGLLHVAIGGADVGEALTTSKDVPLVSATGSTRMGRIVGPKVAERFGKTILELGGNNAMIVAPSADMDNAVRAIVFSAVGTCGQRCTSLRRLIVHEDVRDELVEKLKSVYGNLPIGSPLEDGVLVGPLIDKQAFDAMQAALEKAKSEGGKVTGGERVEAVDGGHYVRPAIVEMVEQSEIVKHETFAPILYVLTYKTLDEAIALQNDVPQGLSSCIFSTDLREAETFLSAAGSDCGIANVNIGPSGAEIGGAFGGEKETGGGRESGSDAWKAYMRRQTNTVNYSRELPLAQGIKFDI
ncbi:aldehyde dehydrogenase family protein [Pelagibacterium sp.]|uniref:L-piperidine-6-carboxylate dehydrogenase n=1 Tax=Pelagibacterium sp. TaxID=1967288 RepID=UPI003A93EFF9